MAFLDSLAHLLIGLVGFVTGPIFWLYKRDKSEKSSKFVSLIISPYLNRWNQITESVSWTLRTGAGWFMNESFEHLSGLNLSLKRSNLKGGGRWIRHYMNCHKHTKESWSGRISLCFSHSCHMSSEDVYSTNVVWTTFMILSWCFHVSFQAWKVSSPIYRDCMEKSLFTVNYFSFVFFSGNIYTLETWNVIHVVTS